MNPTEGILYQIGDKIVCAEREKPNKYDGFFTNDKDIKRFNKALKLFEESCKEVVNISNVWNIVHNMGELPNLIKWDGDWWWNPTNELREWDGIKSGQKVLKVPEGDKVRIVELR